MPFSQSRAYFVTIEFILCDCVCAAIMFVCRVCVCCGSRSGNREHEVFLGSDAADHAVGFRRDVAGHPPHSDTEFRCVCCVFQ